MKSIIIGFIFGIILPVSAVFVGLQGPPPLADMLLFPASVVSSIFDQPPGDLPKSTRVGLLIFSGAFWALAFWLITRVKNKFYNQR